MSRTLNAGFYFKIESHQKVLLSHVDKLIRIVRFRAHSITKQKASHLNLLRGSRLLYYPKIRQPVLAMPGACPWPAQGLAWPKPKTNGSAVKEASAYPQALSAEDSMDKVSSRHPHRLRGLEYPTLARVVGVGKSQGMSCCDRSDVALTVKIRFTNVNDPTYQVLSPVIPGVRQRYVGTHTNSWVMSVDPSVMLAESGYRDNCVRGKSSFELLRGKRSTPAERFRTTRTGQFLKNANHPVFASKYEKALMAVLLSYENLLSGAITQTINYDSITVIRSGHIFKRSREQFQATKFVMRTTLALPRSVCRRSVRGIFGYGGHTHLASYKKRPKVYDAGLSSYPEPVIAPGRNWPEARLRLRQARHNDRSTGGVTGLLMHPPSVKVSYPLMNNQHISETVNREKVCGATMSAIKINRTLVPNVLYNWECKRLLCNLLAQWPAGLHVQVRYNRIFGS
jgi:hypothetical protein